MATAQLSTAAFVEALGACGLLDPPRLGQLTGKLALLGDDPHRLASRLVQEGCLTPYQANRVLAGRGSELVLSHYLLLERLGEGGMAQVFKARHRMIDRVVALKLVHPDHVKNPQALIRFRREMRSVAQLNHPNIVTALDADEVDGICFFVMEFVDGVDLGRLVKRVGPLPVAQTCDFIRQTACGLAHAYEKGLVHRDIKPSNLIVTQAHGSESGGLVKILDLGLARSRLPENTEESATVTQAGMVVGTPDFLAPEQASDAQKADIRADIYSLGATAYYLLTGQVPFPGGSTIDKLVRQRFEEPTPLRELRPEVPAALARLVQRMLAKSPEDRPQTPGDVVSALEAYCRAGADGEAFPADVSPDDSSASETLPPRPVTVAGLFFTDRKRRNVTMGTAIACLVVGFGLLVLLFIRSGTAPANRTAIDDPLGPFQAQAAKPGCDYAQLRGDLIAFRSLHRGTPLGQRATELLQKLPAAFEALAASQVPLDQRFALRGAELVAVLGDGRLRHWDRANALACDPAGRFLVSGGEDRQVTVWDTVSGKRRHSFEGHAGPIRCLAVSKDGGRFASAGSDHTVRLWDVNGRREVACLKHRSAVLGLALSPDGRELASVTSGSHGEPGLVCLWSVPQRKRMAALSGHQGPINTVAYRPDGRLIASGSEDQTIRLWEGGKEIAVLRGHQGPILALAFVGDGNTLVSGSSDKTVRVWDVRGRKEQHPPLGQPHPVRAVAAIPGGTLIAASGDGLIKLWDTANAQDRGTLHGHAGPVTALAVFADGRKLLSAGHDRTIRIWDIAQQRQCTPGDPEPILTMALSPDDQLLATGHHGGKVRLRNPANRHERGVLEGHQGDVLALAFSPDGRVLASGGSDHKAILWQATSVKRRLCLEGHTAPITAVAFGPDGRHLLTASHDRTIRIWGVAAGRVLDTLNGHREAVCAIAISPDGRTLATGSFDRQVRVWEMASAQERRVLNDFHGESLLFTADGKALLGGSAHGTVRSWNLSPGANQEYRTLPDVKLNWPRAGALSLDGRRLALAGSDGQVVIWDLPHNQELRRLHYPGLVQGLAFTSDGRHLVSVNGNGTVALARLPPAPAAARNEISSHSLAYLRR